MPLGLPIPMFQKGTCGIRSDAVSAARADEDKAWQEVVYYIHRSKTGVAAHHTESRGQSRWWQELEDKGQGGELRPQSYWGFHGKGKTGRNKQLRIGQFEQSQHALGYRSSCLDLSPG